jgi:hypothetical protein
MSNKALTWAFEQRCGSAGRKAVLVALADKADEAHSCYPSQALLAQMTEQSERAVRGHLAALVKMGLVVRARRFTQAGHRTSDRYELPVSLAVAVSHRQDPPPAESATGRMQRPAGRPPAESAARQPDHRQNDAQTYRQNLPGNPKEEPKDQEIAPRKRVAAEKGTRIPDGWKRSELDVAWQRREQIPDAFARPVTAEFVNYWHAASGRNATKRDWSAAWKQWMSREWREKGPRWARDHEGADPAAEARVAARRRSALPGAR